jgi:uncharacterized SAM-binding protein YcdF (DUF218 family)
MFYVLSKIGGFLIAPSNLLTALVLLGILLAFTRFARAGRLLALLGLLAILLVGLGPAGNWLMLALEERFPPPAADAPAPDGIVVLGGGVEDRVSAARAQLQLNEAGDRIWALAELARRYPDARIVFSGGVGALFGGSDVPEAEIVGAGVAALGLDPARLELESASRTTAQNARFTAEMVRPAPGETWWLVTSAFHMPRSVGAFRAAGFPVVAYPVDYRTAGPADAWRTFSTVSDGLRRTDAAAREYVGLLAYRLTGRTDALFPAPGH